MQMLIFGHGYSSAATASAIHALDPAATITGTHRAPDAEAEDGVRLLGFDGAAPSDALRAALAEATHVLVSIPPGADGDPVLTALGDALKGAPRLGWIGYFSTVGVYGDFGGAWVDESASTEPTNRRSQWRVKAEADWRALAEERDLPLLVLRLAGIYGPGRSGFDKVRDGTARRIVKPGQVFNRIHVEDIGRVTALAAERRLGGTFNLADGEPAPPQDVVAHAAGLIGVPVPPDQPFETAEMTEMARSFYSDNKRIASRAILEALGISLLYPSYREGLAAILAAETGRRTP